MRTTSLTPTDALALEREVRERVRMLPLDDPTRRDELDDLLAALRAARPDVRSGAHVGRRVSTDPDRVAHRDLSAAIKRTLKARDRKPRVAARPQVPEDPYERAEAREAERRSILGYLARYEGELRAIAAEHEAVRNALGDGGFRSTKGGGTFRSMAPLNEEARKLLADLRAERRALRTRYERFLRRPQDTTRYDDADLNDAVAARVTALREASDDLAAALQDSATRRKPIAPALHERLETVEAYFRATGKVPTARQLNAANRAGVPSYAELRRILGPSPMPTLRALLERRLASI